MNALELLENLPISKGIAYKQLEEISKHCLILEYEKDELVYSKDIRFHYIGLIIDGKVEYYFTDAVSKKSVHLGSFKKYPVGMFNFLELKEEDIYIKAVEKTEILAINMQSLEELEMMFPFFTNKMYKSIISLQLSIIKRILSVITKLGKIH